MFGIPFSFTSIGPGGDGTTIKFRAHLGDISDSNSASWDEEDDMGRADKKFMYGGWSRTIGLSFQVIALSRQEHQVWLDALNSLAEMTKPVYRGGLGFNGVMTQMVVGDLYNVPGFLNSVDFSISTDQSWIDGRPIYIDVSIDFRVVQNRRPEYKRSDPTFIGSFGAGRDS